MVNKFISSSGGFLAIGGAIIAVIGSVLFIVNTVKDEPLIEMKTQGGSKRRYKHNYRFTRKR